MILKKNNKKKVFFLYDKFKDSGNGHLLRCKYFSKIFPKSFKFLFINSKSNFLTNKKKLQKYEFGIVDSYIMTYKREKALKKICKKMITIDDFSNRKFASDIVINYSPLAKKSFYKKKNFNSKLLLGPRFNFILSLQKLNKRKINKKINIFFYLGSKNRLNIINSLISKIKNKKNYDKIYIFGNRMKVSSHGNFLNKMHKSDVLVISAGVTLQEAIAKRKMIFSTYFSQNQKSFYKFYKKKGLIQDIKYFSKFINFPKSKIDFLIKKQQRKIERYKNKSVSKVIFWRTINA